MAFYRKLTEGWRLTDGILPESLMERPMSVYEALRADGRVPDAEVGLNAMACEWIAAREWTYSLMLEAPEEDDERVIVELPKAAGAGKAYLNGEFLGEFTSGAVRLDLTGAIRAQGENRLEIRFGPAPYLRPQEMRPVPEIGLLCAPVMRAVNFATIESISLSSRMEGETGVISAEITLTAHVAGKYSFRYALSLDGEAAGQHERTEKLPAARRTVRHEIRVEKAAALEKNRMDETVYGVRFELDRGGIGCDVRHMETAFREKEPMRCAAVHEWPVSGDMIDAVTAMGADGIVLLGMPANAFERNDFLSGLTVVPDGERADAIGMMRAEAIAKCAAGEIAWPFDSALWRLRGGIIPQDAFGMDAGRYARAMRFRQAAQVTARAEKLRREKKRVTAQVDEEFAYFAGNALIERSSEARPALSALKFAWQQAHAFCELPGGGRSKPDVLLQMNVWALAEEMRGSVMRVSVRVMDMEGTEVAAESFPVMGGDVRLAGMVSLRTPQEECLLIVRTELSEARGGLIACMDSVLAVCAGDPMELMSSAKAAEISFRDGVIRNTGDTAALGAGVCLLPGEETDRTDTEWFNA